MNTALANQLVVLHLEDNPLDAELIREALAVQGLPAQIISVDSEKQFRKALAACKIDVILSDYSLPGFGGTAALNIAREIHPDIPFIFVSGTIGEEMAIQSLKSGATDYVFKHQLQSLRVSIERALREVEERQEHQLADSALRESEERYRVLFENISLPMWVYDRDTLQFLAVNQAAVNHYGYSREEFLAMTLKELRSPQQIPEFLKYLAEKSQGAGTSGVWQHQTKNGDIIDVEISSHPIILTGRIAEVVVAKDVTEQRRTEETMRLQSAALEAAANAIVITNSKGKIIWVNPAFCETSGYSSDDVLDKTPRVLKSGKQSDAFYQVMWDTILGGDVWHGTLVNRHKNGTFIEEDLTITPIVNGQQEITHFVGIKQDITEIKKTEQALQEANNRLKQALFELQTKSDELSAMTQQLWQASKLATMGELAASVAHELNNPLATISLRTESMLDQLPEGDARQQPLEVISQEAERMGTLVANLLQFSRRSHRQVSTVDLRDELDSTLDLTHYHLRSHKIEIVKNFTTNLPTVQADRQQLRQVFLNLLTNAADAMPNGGTITISLNPSQFADKEAVRVEITDTGTGIDEADLAKLWEPFFTTKPEGKGTGLGLPICRRTIEEHKGTISIDSVPGKGTKATILLPTTEHSLSPQ